jgi:hypothetical protein
MVEVSPAQSIKMDVCRRFVITAIGLGIIV